MPAETEGKEFDDVDWGSPDSETWSLQKLQKKIQTEVRPPTWGTQGPRTPSRSPHRDGTSLAAQRPRTKANSLPFYLGARAGTSAPIVKHGYVFPGLLSDTRRGNQQIPFVLFKYERT